MSDHSEPQLKEASDALLRGDYASAKNLFEVLAANGSKGALLGLATIYERGGNGVPKDFIKARYWYERALTDAKSVVAALTLGNYYFHGFGVPVDDHKAYFYYSKLENTQEPVALLRLGILYETGRGVEQNIDKARDFYRRATRLGNIFALKNWGVLEIKYGNRILGILLWTWARLIGTPLAFINPDHKKLRTY
ncbi:MAG: tetratricopeptide repeat protein [Gammaproteobacteria bacterium]